MTISIQEFCDEQTSFYRNTTHRIANITDISNNRYYANHCIYCQRQKVQVMTEQHLSDAYVVIVGYVFRSRRVSHLQQVKTSYQYRSSKHIAY